MPLEIRMRKVPDFLSWQRFLRRQRLLFSWNTEPQRIPEDSLSERSGTRDQKELLVYAIEDPKSIGNLRHFKQRHVRSTRKAYPQAVYQQKVDVIVPVYNGLEYFDALFSGIEKTKVPYRLIIVNDKSPDPEVGNYLEKYAAEHDNVVLLNNETNMGFLPSVNRGLKMAENHVALVNTDVEVPEEWLERLMLPIFAKENIATTTPFTTCGTICSFPDFCRDNKLFEECRCGRSMMNSA